MNSDSYFAAAAGVAAPAHLVARDRGAVLPALADRLPRRRPRRRAAAHRCRSRWRSRSSSWPRSPRPPFSSTRSRPRAPTTGRTRGSTRSWSASSLGLAMRPWQRRPGRAPRRAAGTGDRPGAARSSFCWPGSSSPTRPTGSTLPWWLSRACTGRGRAHSHDGAGADRPRRAPAVDEAARGGGHHLLWALPVALARDGGDCLRPIPRRMRCR